MVFREKGPSYGSGYLKTRQVAGSTPMHILKYLLNSHAKCVTYEYIHFIKRKRGVLRPRSKF